VVPAVGSSADGDNFAFGSDGFARRVEGSRGKYAKKQKAKGLRFS